ncbi:MAG: hypothetical protein R3345_09725 [Fulvivirga sp.]|nr:hypothetical protein [Fulvivirga sp.]
MKDKKRNYLKWLLGLTLISLITPFIFLKIGPGGYEFYGSDVPDIYILGGNILGKDRSWWAINFAYKFQLFMILTSLGLLLFAYTKNKGGNLVKWPLALNLGLLLLFPIWLTFYTSHVINNSDGADLTVYPHIGLFIYLVGLILNLILLKKTKSASGQQ